MIFAIVENNKVTNTIVADKKFVSKFYPDAIDITEIEPQPGVGWFYIDGQWKAPIIDETLA